jgi:proline iminopeptidase
MKIASFIKYALLVCIVILLFKVFLPRKYNVPALQKIASTQFWNLPTGSRISYSIVSAKGKKRPYPIIYLHGGPGGVYSGEDIERLSVLANEGYDVYLYDQIGSGQSDRLANINHYTADRHKRDLEEIIKKIGAKKVVLLGQSWGAILAVFFTADNMEKVDRIVFISPGPIFPIHRELANIMAPDSLHLREPYYSNAEGNDKANNIRTKSMKFFAEKIGWKLASDKEADDFSDYLNSEVDRSTVCDSSKKVKPTGGSGYYAQVITMKTINQVPDPRSKLKNSQIPVLIMKGQCDNQKWGFVTEYLELFPNHKLTIIPSAGHFIWVEQPELYLKTLQTFLNN